ncbi:MAG: hypothetical protein AB1638_00545 [Nitrospirota bacterium]
MKYYPLYSYKIEYFLNPDSNKKIFTGFTFNVSNSGFCLYTSELLNEGQKIVINNNLLVASKLAIVRWIEKYDEIFYMAGLEFI